MKEEKTPACIFMMDLHIKENTIELAYSLADQVIQKCIDKEVDTVFQGGDIFDSRKSQPLSILLAVKKIFKRFHEAGIALHIIAGNHDKVSLDSEESYLDLYDTYENIYVAGKEKIVDLNALDIHLLPYFDENGSYVERLKKLTDQISEDKIAILITHIGINGALNNSEEEVNNQVTPKLFTKYFKTLIGHYHNRSKVNNHIEYSGSCYQANFGEDDQKGCTLVFEDGSTEFMQLDFPKFITVEQDVKASQEEFSSLVESVKESTDNIRVKLISDGVVDHRSRKTMLEEVGVKVHIDKKDVLINPAEAIAIYKPVTSEELIKDFDLWVAEKEPNDVDFGKKILFDN